MQASVCRYCTWPDKAFGKDNKNICKKCTRPVHSLSKYYRRQLRQHDILYDDLIKLIVQFVMKSSKPSKRKRKKPSLHFDVVDQFGKIYSAKILYIRGSPLYTELGLVKYDGWGDKWNEFVDIDSPRLIKHRKYSKSGGMFDGIDIDEKTPNYEQIKKEVDIAIGKWKYPDGEKLSLNEFLLENNNNDE